MNAPFADAHYSSQDKRRIVHLLRQGMSDKEIGREIGRTPDAVKSFRRRNGLLRPRRATHYRWTPERRAELHRLYAVEGRSARECAEIFGMTRNAIIGAAYRNGWKRGAVLKPEPPPAPVVQLATPVPSEPVPHGRCTAPGCTSGIRGRPGTVQPGRDMCAACITKNAPARTRETVFVGRGGDVFSTPARADVR